MVPESLHDALLNLRNSCLTYISEDKTPCAEQYLTGRFHGAHLAVQESANAIDEVKLWKGQPKFGEHEVQERLEWKSIWGIH